MTGIYEIPLTQLGLEISPTVQAASWTDGQSALSAAAHWQIYFNQLCLETFLPWLKAEYEANANVWPDQISVAPLWQIVNGTGIVLDPHGPTEKRLVLIPTDSIESTELRVPQEWVEIPSWVGDYYLAVAVNPEGDFLRVYGYATHEQIKNQGTYDAIDRTYSLSLLELVEDLSALWVVRELNPQEVTQGAIPRLPAMTDAALPAFVNQLMRSIQLEGTPRLDLAFNQWATFLERDDRSIQLERAIAQSSQQSSLTESFINLGQWLENVFENAWQSIESVLGSEPDLAFGFRKVAEPTSQSLRRIKLVHLISETLDYRVLLMVSLVMEPDGRLAVQVTVLPSDRSQLLPSGLQLLMMSSSGSVVQSVQATAQDRYMQLKLFKCAVGTRFGLVVSIGGVNAEEQFIC